MTMINSIGTKQRKILIITSSGGGGLLQTAIAKEQEFLAKDPNLVFVRRDLLKEWVPFGPFFINLWNNAQKKGNVATQMFCVKLQGIFDFFLFPSVFFNALYTIFKEDIDHIIDTQPLCTSAIVKALRIFNQKRFKNTMLEKVLVDLPTKKATHFFRPIKALSKNSRKFFQLTSIPPLLDEGETAEQFWQTTCGLSEKEINCEDVYVRQAFQKYKNIPRPTDSMPIKLQFSNEEEIRLMEKTFQRGSISSKIKKNEVEFSIHPNDRVMTILLGSQAAAEASLGYVKQLINLAREFPQGNNYIFIFCTNQESKQKNLFQKMVDLVAEIKDYPANLSIIPFSFQNENAIAPLFFRSDITCTRSGGQTAMELICVSTGEIWIHSEAKKGEDLLRGIPGWESASAVYLQKLHGAKVVTPETFIPDARNFFETNRLLSKFHSAV